METAAQSKFEIGRRERRDRVIAVARELFARQGFNGTGIAQICKDAEIAPQQLYRDFASKESIVEAIVEADISELFSRIAQLAPMPDGQDPDWERYADGFFRPLLEPRDWSLFLEIQAQASRNERIADICRRCDADMRVSMDAVLAKFGPSPLPAARRAVIIELIMVTIFGVAGRRVANPELDTEALIHLVKTCLAGEIGGGAK